jgi:hypothetical protein
MSEQMEAELYGAEDELYGAICDVIERNYHGWPLVSDSGVLHTSTEARTAANRILELVREFTRADATWLFE